MKGVSPGTTQGGAGRWGGVGGARPDWARARLGVRVGAVRVRAGRGSRLGVCGSARWASWLGAGRQESARRESAH